MYGFGVIIKPLRQCPFALAENFNGVPVLRTLVNPSWHLTPVTLVSLRCGFQVGPALRERRGSVLGR